MDDPKFDMIESLEKIYELARKNRIEALRVEENIQTKIQQSTQFFVETDKLVLSKIRDLRISTEIILDYVYLQRMILNDCIKEVKENG